MANLLQTRLTLIARVRDPADHSAWTEFATLYTPIIFGFLTKRGLSPTDAEDVTQEVFRSLAQALPTFQLDRSIGTFRNWLFTVTRSKLNTHLAKSRKIDIPTSDLPEPNETTAWDQLYLKELFAKACQIVQADTDNISWQAFWRTAVEDQPPKDVANALNLSLDNVYQKKSRLSARIREAIATLDDSAIE
ncbi:MAG: sigma-70 family RNA polymerase sigma factor [Verrucomicrobiota bacterium]